MSGAGKTTISRRIEQQLRALGCRVEVLDGDELRHTLGKGLQFSREDRDENIRRIGYAVDTLLMKRPRTWSYRRLSLSDGALDGASLVPIRSGCRKFAPSFDHALIASH